MKHKNSLSLNPNTVGLRLEEAMKKNRVTAAELARSSGVLTSFIYDILRGKSNNPSIIKLASVAESLGISLPDLVRSKPETGIGDTKNYGNENYVSIPHIKLSGSNNKPHTVISFREDGELFRFSKGWLQNNITTDISSLRMLTVSGDSMEPTIYNNDVVMIDTNQKSPSPPNIFALFDGFGLSVKRLEYVFGGQTERIRAISDNQRYSAYEKSASEVAVVGRVVWFSRTI